MTALLLYFRARFAERSSRVQILSLVLVIGVLTGLFTFEGLTATTAKIAAVLPLINLLAGVLIPDKNAAVATAAEADAVVGIAVDIATAAAEKAAGPEATVLARNVGGLMDKLGL